jgi:hypothetical protein
MAFGAQRYFDQAETLARSLAVNMPGVPISLVTDRPSAGPIFERAIPIEPAHGLGTLQKIHLDRYTPYARTLFVDADSIVARPFHDELGALARHPFTPVAPLIRGPGDRDEFFADLGRAMAAAGAAFFAKFNGGLYHFDRSPAAAAVFEEARALRGSAEALGIVPFDRAGPGDESLFGLALGRLGMRELHDDGGRLMATPIGMTGPLRIDPLGGGSRFVKHGRAIEPAICHFAGIHADRIEYRTAEYLLRRGAPSGRLSAAERGRLALQHHRARAGRLMGRRWRAIRAAAAS